MPQQLIRQPGGFKGGVTVEEPSRANPLAVSEAGDHVEPELDLHGALLASDIPSNADKDSVARVDFLDDFVGAAFFPGIFGLHIEVPRGFDPPEWPGFGPRLVGPRLDLGVQEGEPGCPVSTV